jgi:hypothetical protein
LFAALFSKLPKFVLFILAKKCIESSGSVFTPLLSYIKFFMRKMVYKEKTWVTSNGLSIDYHVAKELQSEIPKLTSLNNPLSMAIESNSTDMLSISYIPLFHSRTLETMEEKGKVNYEKFCQLKANKKAKFLVASSNTANLTYEDCTYSELFPSVNYQRLSSSIERHFHVCKKVKANNVLGILINGVPGLGKTKFSEYAASKGLADTVYKIDMSKFLDRSFELISETFYFNIQVKTPSIFIIDELDKYLDFTMKKEFYHSNLITKATEQEGDSFEIFEAREKPALLYRILNLLERDTVQAPCVLLFCSNNFTSIFSGVDITHYQSLYDRFMKFTFEVCDHTELVRYIMYYSELIFDDPDELIGLKEKIEMLLNKGVKITHRKLHHLSIEAMYDPIKMVELLNVHKDIFLTQEMVTPTKIIPSAKVIQEETSKKVIPSAKVIQEETSTNKDDSSDDSSDESSDDSSDDSSDGEEYEKNEYGFYVSKKPESQLIPSIDEEVFDAENYDYKNWDPEYIKTLPNHFQVWINDFVVPAMSDSNYEEKDKRETRTKIRDYLAKCESARGCENKSIIVKELFQYMASTTQTTHFLINQKAFIKTVQNKIKELAYDTHKPLAECDGKTKKFLYAISGISV